MKSISKYIDHTLLAQDATMNQIELLCKEAVEHSFCSVCINSSYVKYAKSLTKLSDVKVCSVVGFPLGAMSSEAKAYETQIAIADGADEIDMVINVGMLKSEKLEEFQNDIQMVRDASEGKVLKVILETALLDDAEIVKACEISLKAGADFVKTSTGFSTAGATVEHVVLMKSTVGDNAEVKASGGVRSYETALEMIEAGASRLGTSSGIAIISGQVSNKEY